MKLSQILFGASLLGGLSIPARAEVYPQWTWELPERQGAWEEVKRIEPDQEYPVFAQGELVFVSCEHNGALLALEAKSGTERWRFHTEGPLRTAAAGDGQRVFVGSDDGYLYCIDPSGKLLWKKRGGASAQKVIGHERIVSAWNTPAAPLVRDGVVYYLAGYWPLEGVYLHALECASGRMIWTNGTLEVRGHTLRLSEAGELVIEGHFGGAMVDAKTGQFSREKAPRPPARQLPPVEGLTGTLAASGGERYYTVTPAGEVRSFGPEKVEPKSYSLAAGKLNRNASASALISQSKVSAGYAIVAGLKDGALVEGMLAAAPDLRIVAFDADAERVTAIRKRLDARGVLNYRLALFMADADSVQLPPYIGSLVTTETGVIPTQAENWTRPYGGIRAVAREGAWKLAVREGAPEGAADWKEEFADAANTLASKDRLVKAPLGVLWYGGPAGASRYYYDGEIDHQSGHGLNPQPVPAEIVGGRLILQAPNLIAAFDQYTGRPLWETPLPSVYPFGGAGGGLGIHSENHPFPWKSAVAEKFDAKPTQRCRSTGFNFVSLEDGIYVGAAEKLLRLDPATGKQLAAWPVPLPEPGLCWGGLRIEGDVLVATAFRPQDLADAQAGHDGNGGEWAGDRMPMAHLVALDRQTGRKLWHRPATWGYINRSGFCLGGGKVFCADLLTEINLEKWREAGRQLPTAAPRLLALDLKTGQEVWSFELDVLVRNIAYSAERDLLLAPCRHLTEWREGQWVLIDRSARPGKSNKNGPGRMRAFRGSDGAVRWEVDTDPYYNPHILLHDLVIDRNGFTFDLLSGKRAVRSSPLTGLSERWSFRKGGCNHLIACENMVTWRTAFYDLRHGAGVMKLTGLDAGCSPTLIPAGGILNIPNFGTHHKRNRMTAMALVHRPENELWTEYYTSEEKGASQDPGAVIQRAGYNFGAPGDRQAEGALWRRVDSRSLLGLSIEPRQEVRWLTGHTARTGSWIASSAIVGAQSIRIPLRITAGGKGVKEDREKRRYTVRLHFAELEEKRAGERVFDVSLEGQPVLAQFDIAQVAGGVNRPVTREFRNVTVAGELNLELVPRHGESLLAGIELVVEK
ncbi:MAG: PQQ-binding-like beta-propeller repeat protein [Verrucomicrobiota bacterium]|nr:PQQ-binding-like beta-propeller repeat protein [Verrucomicrobiota bacterium]